MGGALGRWRSSRINRQNALKGKVKRTKINSSSASTSIDTRWNWSKIESLSKESSYSRAKPRSKKPRCQEARSQKGERRSDESRIPATPDSLAAWHLGFSLVDFDSRLFILGAMSGDAVMERSMGEPVFSINFSFSYFQRSARDAR
jgi:hypothetical protein